MTRVPANRYCWFFLLAAAGVTADLYSKHAVFAALGILLVWRVSIEATPIQWRALDPRRWFRRRLVPAPPRAAAG